MKKYITILTLSALSLTACGDYDYNDSDVDSSPSVQTGDNWPQVKSFCSPDQSGVRVYVTRLYKSGAGAAGAAIAVILDSNCP